MILKCSNTNLLEENIENTMSCSHPDIGRYKRETESQHCGTCLPCVIRRASIKRAGITDTSTYRDPSFTSGNTARTNLNTYRMGLRKFENRSNNYFQVQKSGPLFGNLGDYKSVYERGMRELMKLLEEINE